MPDDAFGNARLGDIVVARLETPAGGRFVDGVVADTGSPERSGEASIAFNRALKAEIPPILTGRDVLALDIHGPVAVLILGGSKAGAQGGTIRAGISRTWAAANSRAGTMVRTIRPAGSTPAFARCARISKRNIRPE